MCTLIKVSFLSKNGIRRENGHIDWGEVVKSLTGRSEGDCRQRLQVLHASKGGYFAMIEDFWPKCDDGSDITTVTIDPSSWDALRATVCRTQRILSE